MTSSGISPALREFVDTFLPSVDHVAILLALREAKSPVATVTLQASTRVSEDVIDQVLHDLLKSRLVSAQAGGYVFSAPASMEAQLAELSDFNRTRPVTLIRAIYERATQDPAKSFADAFRIRRES